MDKSSLTEMAAAMWHAEMIYDSTPTEMRIPDAPAQATAALWSVETTNDSSLTQMGKLDPLVEMAAP